MSKISKWLHDLELLKTFVINAFKVKYKRSKLGLSWSMLNPILNITVVSFVFSQVMGMPYQKFVVFYFSGFLAWTLFSSSLLQSANSLIVNEALIKKVPINLIIFPLTFVAVSTVEFLMGFAVLAILLFFLGLKLSMAFLFLPVSLLLLVMFSTGVCLIVSVLTSFYRDVAYILTVVVQLWFYLTPVLYPKKFLLAKSQILAMINPMVVYIDLFRDPIVNGILPNRSVMMTAFFCLLHFFVLVLLYLLNTNQELFFSYNLCLLSM